MAINNALVQQPLVQQGENIALTTIAGAQLETGAQVGVQRNEEFSAGGRTMKFSRNAWVGYRPQFNRDEIELAGPA